MLATFAFDVCHDVYRAARDVIDTKIPTLNLESSGKYAWHPDRMPHLAEYVADFARAGERALGGDGRSRGREGNGKRRRDRERNGTSAGGDAHGCSTICDRREIPRSARNDNVSVTFSSTTPRPSRMVMFRVFYLGGAEYNAARRHLGISEFTWADWADEIRACVGRELTRAGMFPPSKYFLATTIREPDQATGTDGT
jgi:hypothetical protein